MGLLIFCALLFIFAMFLAISSDGYEIFVWALCIAGTIGILVYFFEIPTAMDLHSGKAVIKYEIVDGVKVDLTFVFKDK